MKKTISIICVVVFAALLVLGAIFVLPKTGNGKNGEGFFASFGNNNNKDEVKFSDYDLDEVVTLGDYKNLYVEVNYTEVTETDVINYINDTLTVYPEYEPTQATKVEDGDIVDIDYVGTYKDEEFSGGSAEGAILEIGSGTYIDGFEEGLIGVKVGDTVALNLTFPENYTTSTGELSDMAGKDVVFTITVNAVVDEVIYTYEEIDDAYCLENLGFETKQELYDYVNEFLTSEAESEKESATRSSVVDAVLSISTVKVPKALLEYRVEEYISDFKASVEDAGYDFANYLSTNYGYTEETFETEITSYMEQSLKEQFVLSAIAKEEGMEVDDEGYSEYVNAFVTYYNYSSEEALYEDYPEEEMKTAYLCNNVVDYLLETATIEYISK